MLPKGPSKDPEGRGEQGSVRKDAGVDGTAMTSLVTQSHLGALRPWIWPHSALGTYDDIHSLSSEHQVQVSPSSSTSHSVCQC